MRHNAQLLSLAEVFTHFLRRVPCIKDDESVIKKHCVLVSLWEVLFHCDARTSGEQMRRSRGAELRILYRGGDSLPLACPGLWSCCAFSACFYPGKENGREDIPVFPVRRTIFRENAISFPQRWRSGGLHFHPNSVTLRLRERFRCSRKNSAARRSD